MGIKEIVVKYQFRKTLEKGLKSLISGGLAVGTAYLAKKGLNLDLGELVNQPMLVEFLSGLVLAALFGLFEALRNFAKHRFGFDPLAG